ncbi:hypothetical protein K505DRAFT_368274 [Melanomma pulvis-pyrius CBS 109.77]|uniref:Uncharacterized protein n=1 Tax=Melanomma pulvis-pyrius CBS 109.77 TaxID=1314802 RepID=A0A6A6WQM3_9PLEO|nr:hypothetical protein K505DRAFT_368274 [Melanomma pulvis-pyrius CBS 109.77]
MSEQLSTTPTVPHPSEYFHAEQENGRVEEGYFPNPANLNPSAARGFGLGLPSAHAPQIQSTAPTAPIDLANNGLLDLPGFEDWLYGANNNIHHGLGISNIDPDLLWNENDVSSGPAIWDNNYNPTLEENDVSSGPAIWDNNDNPTLEENDVSSGPAIWDNNYNPTLEGNDPLTTLPIAETEGGGQNTSFYIQEITGLDGLPTIPGDLLSGQHLPTTRHPDRLPVTGISMSRD